MVAHLGCLAVCFLNVRPQPEVNDSITAIPDDPAFFLKRADS